MYRIVEGAGAWRMVLPQRHPVDFRREKAGCGCMSVLLAGGAAIGIPFLGVLLEAFDEFNAGTFGRLIVFLPLGIAGGFSLVLLAWMFVGGRSEIRMTSRRLRLIERIGPLVFMVRSLPLERVSGFRAHPFNNGRGCLTFDVQGAAQRRWAIEYPIHMLETAAGELARRRDALLEGKVVGPADVEHGADVLRVKVPALGWRFRYLVGAGVLVLLSLGTIWLGMKMKVRPLPILVPLVLLGAVGVEILRSQGRTHGLELGDASLRIVSRDFLRTRTRSWERRDVWGYEVVHPEDASTSQLRVRLRSGKQPVLLDGRDSEELEWIASVLRRGRLKQDVRVVAASGSERGTCHVCGDPMEERVVWCRKCRTPHHRECWIYTGMCATFGCREIGYTDM